MDIVSDGGSDTLTGGPFSNCWGIDNYDGKYVLKNANSTSSALRCTAGYPGADILTEAYSASNSNFHWTLDSSPSGVVLYDTSTNCAVTNPTRYMAVGETKSLSALNLQAVSYSASTNSTSFTWTITGTSATINQNTGAVTCVSAGNATITGRVSLDGTYHYVNYTIEVSNLLIYQTAKTYYSDADGNYAEDLVCGDMSEDDLRALDWLNWTDFVGDSADIHKENWKSMCTSLFSEGELETVILDMIDHFMGGSGLTYSNSVLTQNAHEHGSTQEYIENVEERIRLLLNTYGGNINALAYTAATRESNPLVQALKGVNEPVYNTSSDTTNGLRICVNGLWGNKIEVSSYSISGNSYLCTLHYTLYDHFGLNQADVEKYGYGSGFRSWYILQHYSEYNSAYKPFLTLIEFDVTISGTIS